MVVSSSSSQPKRWYGEAEILREVTTPAGNHFFAGRVIKDPHGKQESLQGLIFYRAEQDLGWMRKGIGIGDVVTIEMPVEFGKSDFVMYCAQNFMQPEEHQAKIKAWQEGKEEPSKPEVKQEEMPWDGVPKEEMPWYEVLKKEALADEIKPLNVSIKIEARFVPMLRQLAHYSMIDTDSKYWASETVKHALQLQLMELRRQ